MTRLDPDPTATLRLRAFLGGLAEDAASAGVKYEHLRDRLVLLFRCRGLSTPEDLADETIDRVARRLAEGVVLRSSDVVGYLMGTAEKVALEARRRQLRIVPLEIHHLGAVDQEPVDEAQIRLRARYVGMALAELAAEDRRLLLLYIKAKAAARAELAAAAGMGMNALRIRIHRLRARVEARVHALIAGEPS